MPLVRSNDGVHTTSGQLLSGILGPGSPVYWGTPTNQGFRGYIPFGSGYGGSNSNGVVITSTQDPRILLSGIAGGFIPSFWQWQKIHFAN
jgi:hypothetical protein